MPQPLPDTTRQAIADLIAAGLGRNAIRRQLGVSADVVTRAARDLGHTFPGTRGTGDAVAAAAAKRARAARARQVADLADPQCTATAKQSRQRCGAPKVPGLNVCRRHGVNSAARTVGKERLMAEEARKLIPDLDELDPITDPLGRLLELATEADAFREGLKRLVNDLNQRIRYTDAKDAEQLRSEVAMYRGMLGDVTTMLVAIAKLDIDSRLARIQEQQFALIVAALTAGMTDAGLPEGSKRVVMAGVTRHLRAVPS